MGSRLCGSKRRVVGEWEGEGKEAPRIHAPPWVPAFAGMTRWGAGMMKGVGMREMVEGEGRGGRAKRGTGNHKGRPYQMGVRGWVVADGRGGGRMGGGD